MQGPFESFDARQMKFEFERDDGELVDVPATYEVCRQCDGHGSHSLALGAITEEDRDRDWSPDEWDGYVRGDYDQTCEVCGGKRVEAVLDRKRVSAELLRQIDDAQRSLDECYEMEAMERRYGA